MITHLKVNKCYDIYSCSREHVDLMPLGLNEGLRSPSLVYESELRGYSGFFSPLALILKSHTSIFPDLGHKYMHEQYSDPGDLHRYAG